MTQTPEDIEESIRIPDVLPILPVRDSVVFPFVIVPLSVSEDPYLQVVDHSLARDRLLFLVSQRDPRCDDPRAEDLHPVGTVATIMRMLKLPDGRVRVLVQGLLRARLVSIISSEPFLQGRLEPLEDEPFEPQGLEVGARMRSIRERLEQAAGLGKNVSPDVLMVAANLEDVSRLADLAASNLELEVEEAQPLLENLEPIQRLEKVSDLLSREIQVLKVQNDISSEARNEMDRSQREYFLRQQMKAIQDELGEVEETVEEIETFRRLAKEKGIPEAALEELERQIRRLRRSHPDSAETTTIRTYLEWITALPWSVHSEDVLDLQSAREILDEDHYGLNKVKERVIEYLAVRKLKGDAKGPLLCFVGPPGVGKTSLGRSIARALGRKFVRISLGGVRDEAEIRGHRRTYIGALPGRILQGLQQAETSNPVFMLDEIDKIGQDFRGDPSSALLEVLDPEQNSTFRDHYLGMDYDLSKVLFIATANLLNPIQPAFLDRMEVLRLSGYTPEEKLLIARRHLIPKQLEETGLKDSQVRLTDTALKSMIRSYTKEAGLRNLEREIAAVCRKVAVRIASGQEVGRKPINAKSIERLLGPAKHFPEELLSEDRLGVATGLAWTEHGGDLLFIEAVVVPGKGELTLTGQLGDVMKESAQAALSYARLYASRLGIGPEYFSKQDLHIHVPAGSVPKDGPSAGITIACAILSLLAKRPVSRRLAMTGEITLRGDVLPIGGLKEKVLAARAAGIETLLLPKLNRRDLQEVPAALKRGITFRSVDHMDQVVDLALLSTKESSEIPQSAAAS